MSSKRSAQPARQPRVATAATVEEYDEDTVAASEFTQSIVKFCAASFYARVNQVLSDEGCFAWMEETGKTKSELMAKIFDSPATISGGAAKKKKDTPSISVETLQRTIDNFKDGYKPGGCLMSIKHAIVEGRDPFTLCGAKATGGVCSECLKKKSGKELAKEVAKRGFEVPVHRGINAANAARWATNKLKTMQTKVANDKIRTLADSSSEAEDEAAPAAATGSDEWSIYEHSGAMGRDDLDFHNNWGLVAELHGTNEHRVIGMDFDMDGNMRKLTPDEAGKFEDLGFVILSEAVEEEKKPEKKPSVSQRPARTPVAPASPVVPEPDAEI